MKINADQQPHLMRAYEVQGLPTHFILEADGSVVDKGVGYGGPAAIYSFLERNKGK